MQDFARRVVYFIVSRFYRTFGLTQKYQKVKHGEKLRALTAALAERSRKTALFARSLRALPPRPSLFRTFRSAVGTQCLSQSSRHIIYRYIAAPLEPRGPQPPAAEARP